MLLTKNKTKPDTTKLVQTFGERMQMARELCGFSQIKAAELLGYGNSTKLSKVENASDTNSVPWWLIPRAAEVYCVSSDFLLGLSNECQRNTEEVQQKQLEHILEHVAKTQAEAIRSTYDRFSFLAEVVVSANIKASQIKATLARFAELNVEFEDMACSAKLVRLIHEASRDASKAVNALNNFPSSN